MLMLYLDVGCMSSVHCALMGNSVIFWQINVAHVPVSATVSNAESPSSTTTTASSQQQQQQPPASSSVSCALILITVVRSTMPLNTADCMVLYCIILFSLINVSYIFYWKESSKAVCVVLVDAGSNWMQVILFVYTVNRKITPKCILTYLL